MERLDALSAREGKDGKSYFTKIGAAFPNKDGKGWSVLLDAIPAPTDGQFKVMLREPLPPRDGGGYSKPDSQGSAPSAADLDDDIPF
jgi:hypothetical protein